MNVNIYNTTDYENKSDWTLGENKPNSNPIKPNLRKSQMNVNLTLTKDYRKNDDFTVRINKPNSNPISVKPKMSANAFSQKVYENETAFRPKKTNPIQSQFLQRPKSLAGKSGHALVIQGLIFSLIRYSLGGIITPVGGTKKQRSRRLLTTFFFSSVKTEQKVGIIS